MGLIVYTFSIKKLFLQKKLILIPFKTPSEIIVNSLNDEIKMLLNSNYKDINIIDNKITLPNRYKNNILDLLLKNNIDILKLDFVKYKLEDILLTKLK